MADNSATATYHGTGLTTAGWQSAAERRNAEPDDCDMAAQCDTDVSLSGRDGEAHGDHVGTKVPNLNVEHHSRPSRTHGLPASHRSDQSKLTAGRGLNRGRRGR